ncbi:hypothetical protein CIG75_18925 [Tumebacillus algifaecis]|uniref:Uncharacterized protein n=1 Tax=Tumebacillus algifaecis TaxID=1214604 RepID=A0A223D5C9_9BACL|nr:hypothetical protein [Tumebacillus algifaecis]ASS76809.1 hypothetical protein CIG75_18925 [Tumebacillus algifaecis]
MDEERVREIVREEIEASFVMRVVMQSPVVQIVNDGKPIDIDAVARRIERRLADGLKSAGAMA